MSVAISQPCSLGLDIERDVSIVFVCFLFFVFCSLDFVSCCVSVNNPLQDYFAIF